VIPGFHVRVYPTGSKTFAVQFQRPGGEKIQVTLGKTTVWTVEDPKDSDGKPLLDRDGRPKKGARSWAEDLRALHDSGQDARAYMQGERSAQDVAALVKLWEEGYRHELKPSSRASYNSVIKQIILPALGPRLVKDLDYPTVKGLHRKESKRHPIGANRMITVLSRLMNIAELEGWRPRATNPCFRFKKTQETPCHRVLSAGELARLGSSVASLVTAGKLDGIAADLIRFLAFSGLRTGEAENLRWTDVDLDRNIMIIRDHKTSATMGPKHLPLNGPLKVILQHRAGVTLDKLVFPGLVKDKPIQGLRHMWLRVLAVEGCELGEATPHDLRRTFMTVTVELGYPPAIGDTLLGHSLGKITDTYTRLSMDGILANASKDAAQWIAAAMRGENPKVGVKLSLDAGDKIMA
jgi:integrase